MQTIYTCKEDAIGLIFKILYKAKNNWEILKLKHFSWKISFDMYWRSYNIIWFEKIILLKNILKLKYYFIILLI